jgi:hypothetical protein
MTDPDVGHRTFTPVLGREPSRAEFAKVMERRTEHLYETVAGSDEYRVLDGVEEQLPRMLDQGYLLGLVTGNVEAAAHIKLHRARLSRFFLLRWLRLGLQRPWGAHEGRAQAGVGGLRRLGHPGPGVRRRGHSRTWLRPMAGRGPRRSPPHRRP